jgi:photosystem II stability/assembly factor-like uncharacterized protein
MMAARVASDEKQMKAAALAPVPPPAAAQIAAANQATAVPAAGNVGRKQVAAEAGRAAPAAAPGRDKRDLETDLATVSAPGGTAMWRFGARGRLARSVDAGASWHAQASGVTADLLAGAALSPFTCWIVGASGTVLLTTDGERWESRPLPLAVDLVAVEASSARAATVTTRDGRRFQTLDAGLTWSPK